jgi:hypothetical protein
MFMLNRLLFLKLLLAEREPQGLNLAGDLLEVDDTNGIAARH